MPEASHPSPETELSPGELVKEVVGETLDALKTDEGVQAAGLVGGAVVGYGVLRAVKGDEANQTAPQQSTLDQPRQSIGVEPKGQYHTHPESGTEKLAEIGIVGGALTIGVIGATIITRMRQRMNERASQPIDSI